MSDLLLSQISVLLEAADPTGMSLRGPGYDLQRLTDALVTFVNTGKRPVVRHAVAFF